MFHTKLDCRYHINKMYLVICGDDVVVDSWELLPSLGRLMIVKGNIFCSCRIFYCVMHALEQIVMLLPRFHPSVGLRRAYIVIIRCTHSAGFLYLDSPMFWAPWHQSMSTYSQSSFFNSTWKRSGVWMCKLGKALNTNNDKISST